MRWIPSLLAVVPFISPFSFAEPGGPVALVKPAHGPASPSAPGSVIHITGKVFFDVNEDGMKDVGEVPVNGFRVLLLEDGGQVDIDITGSEDDGCYSLELEIPSEEEVGAWDAPAAPVYEIKILGPTGVDGVFGDGGVFGFIEEGFPGATWSLTDDQVSLVPIYVNLEYPTDIDGPNFGVLSYGKVVDTGDGKIVTGDLTIEGADFWCDTKNKKVALGILEECDPEWRVESNSFKFQFACLTNQFGAKKGILVFKTNNALPAALNLFCRFLKKGNCFNLLHDLSVPLSLVQLGLFCNSDTAPDEKILISIGGEISEGGMLEFDLADRIEAAKEMLLNPSEDPEFLDAVQACINEWEDAVNGGLFRRSGEPNEPIYDDAN